MNSPESLKAGNSSKHIGLDCPKWSFANGQSRVAECLRSGGGSPKFHGRGTATWRVVVGDRQGGGADGGTARRAPLSSQHAQHHTNRGRCLIPRTLPAHLF